jgi:hypothetical protein
MASSRENDAKHYAREAARDAHKRVAHKLRDHERQMREWVEGYGGGAVSEPRIILNQIHEVFEPYFHVYGVESLLSERNAFAVELHRYREGNPTTRLYVKLQVTSSWRVLAVERLP